MEHAKLTAESVKELFGVDVERARKIFDKASKLSGMADTRTFWCEGCGLDGVMSIVKNNCCPQCNKKLKPVITYW